MKNQFNIGGIDLITMKIINRDNIALKLLVLICLLIKSIAGKQTFGMAVHISSHPGKKGYYLVTAKEGKVYIFQEGSEIKKTILDMVKVVIIKVYWHLTFNLIHILCQRKIKILKKLN